jgi:alkanesulfonate monooxygenase SsuD/methylene tetrahydromethanopterin reductase-like flavin-dependent oxidoreductase (luciferase family)
MSGIENWLQQERLAQFREVVEIMDLCLRNRLVNYPEKFYRIEDAVLNPAPSSSLVYQS